MRFTIPTPHKALQGVIYDIHNTHPTYGTAHTTRGLIWHSQYKGSSMTLTISTPHKTLHTQCKSWILHSAPRYILVHTYLWVLYRHSLYSFPHLLSLFELAFSPAQTTRWKWTRLSHIFLQLYSLCWWESSSWDCSEKTVIPWQATNLCNSLRHC